jgi:hypothetical protein
MSWKDLLPALAAMPLLALVAALLFWECADWLRRGVDVVEDAKRVIEPTGDRFDGVDIARMTDPAGFPWQSIDMERFEYALRLPDACPPHTWPPVTPGYDRGES